MKPAEMQLLVPEAGHMLHFLFMHNVTRLQACMIAANCSFTCPCVLGIMVAILVVCARRAVRFLPLDNFNVHYIVYNAVLSYM